jgi:pyrroline-5-carboxylate reductase
MNVAILGTGNMGRAIIGGLKRAYGGDVRVAVWDKAPEALNGLGDGVEAVEPKNWKSAGFAPDALILAVKPADLLDLLDDAVIPVYKEQKLDILTVSVAAGIPISSIRERLLERVHALPFSELMERRPEHKIRVCRVMPNTPALIGEGISAYSLSEDCTGDDARAVEYIFSACGKVVNLPEGMMDAVTGLSGSGPAFAYSFIEALAEGGVGAGIPYKDALVLAAQTVAGAARMVQATAEHPSVLRSRVMSPGGTTVKGLEALERGAFKSAVISAVAEAAAQSRRMSRKKQP